ncbi:MAG: antibiotic biosynthesis monooxygenase family protein [Solirubrobacterales bacterium]
MNVVQVPEAKREDFERAFAERESHLHQAEGFVGFELLRGSGESEGEYVVLTRWQSEGAFRAWFMGGLFKLNHRHVDAELAESSEVLHYEVVEAARVPA